MPKLLNSCPFCASRQVQVVKNNNFGTGIDLGNCCSTRPPEYVWFVRCEDCYAEGPPRGTKEMAIDAWNFRASLSWSMEIPMEEGWYLVTDPSRKRPSLVEVRMEMVLGKERLMLWADEWNTPCDLWPGCTWLKIEFPFPVPHRLAESEDKNPGQHCRTLPLGAMEPFTEEGTHGTTIPSSPVEKTTGLNFIEAVKAAKSGRTVKRLAWASSTFTWNSGIFINNDTTPREFTFFTEDYLADDWEVLPEPSKLMNFVQAWKLLKAGKKVKRLGWAVRNDHVMLDRDQKNVVYAIQLEHVKSPRFHRFNYEELEATDWIEVE